MKNDINLSEYSTKRLKQFFYVCVAVLVLIIMIGCQFIFNTAEYHGITLARYLVGIMLTVFIFIIGTWFENVLNFMSRLKDESRRRRDAAINGSMGSQDPLGESDE